MADYESRDPNTSFKGLSTTVGVFGVVGAICLIGFETMRQMRRLPKFTFVSFWRRDERQRQGGRGGVDVVNSREKLTSEDWEMGHLYLARMFHAVTPTSPMASWPLAWAYQALKLDDWFYATHTGMDTVVYVRFLRGCVFWVLLQTLTTAPILLAVHLKFSKGVALSDMNSASLSYLVVSCDLNGPYPKDLTKCDRVSNQEGRNLLWIHLCLLWYITLTWFYTLWWIAKGSIRIRRRWIQELRTRTLQANEELKSRRIASLATSDREEQSHSYEVHNTGQAHESRKSKSGSRGDDSLGWRQRTLLVTNLPPTMRDEASVRRYFEEFLRPDDGSPMSSTDDLHLRETNDPDIRATGLTKGKAARYAGAISNKDTDSSEDSHFKGWEEGRTAYMNNAAIGPEPDVRPHRHLRSPIQTVVLVRKMNELSAMLTRRQEVLGQLEAAHIKLAQGVLAKVEQQTRRMQKDDKIGDDDRRRRSTDHIKASRILSKFRFDNKSDKAETGSKEDVEKGGDVVQLQEDALRLNELTFRLAPFVSSSKSDGSINETPRLDGEGENSSPNGAVWEALSEVPRELLDTFQPVTRLSSLFRGQKVPTIDYLLTKLNLLTALVTEMRARPPTSYEPTSTAFVTFRDPRQARMVWRELKSQIVVKVRLAPEVKDLDWERLMRTSFTGDIVRGIGVNTFFWVATILWVVPVSLFTTSLFSVSNLEGLFPSFATFFGNNPNFTGFVKNTLPSLIVSVLTMCVPELIFQVSKRAQGFVTFSALYDQCLCRYWKFVICNVVIFFCLGATTVQSIILQAGRDNNLLDSIAFSFPTAAPFYISYLILGMALHTGFELLGFMVPLIQHLGARKAVTPRMRALKTLPRNFNRYYWLPFHILILSIVFLFALLNPLVIPFALVYLFVALVVFKKNFAYTYFRRFNEKEGTIYYIRLLRFSLDGLLVGQIVLLIFFSVTKQSAVYIAMTAVLVPINVLIKLLATRLWKSQCRALEDDEANALCGIGSSEPLTPSANKRDYFGRNSTYGHSNDEDQLEYTSPLDARASGRYPPVVVAPQTDSKILLFWNYVQDRFNANGNDRPSYIINVQAKGSHLSAKTMTKAVTSAPKALIGPTAEKIRYADTLNKKDRRESKTSESKDASSLDALPVSTKAFKESLEQTNEESKQRKAKSSKQMSLRRGHNVRSARSTRSEEAPFLSGIDAIANHAPVSNIDTFDEEDYEDGETGGKGNLTNKRTTVYSTSIIRGRPLSIVADESHLSIPQETDEVSIRDGLSKEQQEMQDSSNDIEEDNFEEHPLVKPHAKIRWDDTPNNSARYNNPFYIVELDPFLWLPRDPTKPIDLCDTVEWHGAALVSSQGGGGKVGEWDDELEDEEEEKDGQGEESEGKVQPELLGDEQIDIAGPLAQRLQEAEDTEEAVDPTASISRNQMEDYKKALEEERDHEQSPHKRNRFSMRSSSITSRLSNRHSIVSEMHMHRVMSGLSTYDADEGDSAIQEQNEDEQRPTFDDEQNEISQPTTTSLGVVPSTSANIGASLASMQTSKARDHSPSNKTADSVIDHGLTHTATRKRKVSMRKALKAEVLEEEYRRTIKAKVTERRRREKSEMETAKKHQISATTNDNDMEMHDLEAQEEDTDEATMSAIMTRHEHRMHKSQGSTSRRDGNVSVSSVVRSAFIPRRSVGKNA